MTDQIDVPRLIADLNAKGWTLIAIARHLETTHSTVLAWACSRSVPDPDTLVKLEALAEVEAVDG